MNHSLEKIYLKFDNSVNWNGFLYLNQKILTFIFSLILLKKFSQNDFSAWANIMSLVFLIILWMDFGFRKSVPKYVPEFSKNKNSHIFFTKFIIKYQIVFIILATTILLFNLKSITSFLGIKISEQVKYFAIVIFFFESIIALLRLIYHAHFWNKYFNLNYSLIIIIETVFSLFLLFYLPSFTLVNLLTIKIISAAAIIGITIFNLKKLFKKEEYAPTEIINHNQLTKNFLRHSAHMWFNLSLKSLTERNFLVPMMTFLLGPEIANIFKISNDWALLLPRTILRTIGTTDTSLLSHIDTNHKESIHNAFKKLILTISRLCIFMVAIFVFIIIGRKHIIGENPIIFKLFIFLVTFYLIESMLSPFERFLEINKEYLALTISYIPYTFFILLFFNKNIFTSVGLYFFVFVLGFIRLVSSFLLFYFARKKYGLKFLFSGKDLFFYNK